MTQPISSYRPDRSQDVPDSGAGPTPQPATRVAVPQPAIPEYPDTNAALIANAVKAATSSAAQPMLAMGVRAADVENVVLTPLQAKLDAFLESATPTFHAEGRDLQVAIPFRMTVPPTIFDSKDPRDRPFIERERIVQRNGDDLHAVARGLGLTDEQTEQLKEGRSTPETVRRVAQALIDSDKLPPPSSGDAAQRIRAMMSNYGIGIDCAGYVQQAFLASRGLATAPGLRRGIDEDLSGLGQRGFSRVASTDVRAGDLFILGRPRPSEPGHTVIVRDSRMATPEEARALTPRDRSWGSPDASKVRRLEVDSSWGSYGDPQRGGVQRQIWWHDETNGAGKWMSTSSGACVVGPTPYVDHPIEGVYRPSGER